MTSADVDHRRAATARPLVVDAASHGHALTAALGAAREVLREEARSHTCPSSTPTPCPRCGPGADPLPPAARAIGVEAVLRALDGAWARTTAELTGIEAPGARRVDALVELLSAIRACEAEIRRAVEAEREALPARVRAGLASLGRAGSLAELVDEAPVAVAGVGFDRVLLSRVEDAVWIPERMFVRGDARWAQEILDVGRREFRRLDDSLLETQLVRRSVPLLVDNPAGRAQMHRELVTSTQTLGYVAAPISDGREVIGLLHADCYHQQRLPTADELEALWLCAQGLGPLLAREGLLERMAEMRRILDRPSSPFAPSVAADGGAGASVAPSRPAPVRGGGHVLRERVTRREAEVLALMAGGASNDQIARRLVVSIGTVKSHVKSILRKLEVANRAEAVSYWLRSEYGRLSAGPP